MKITIDIPKKSMDLAIAVLENTGADFLGETIPDLTADGVELTEEDLPYLEKSERDMFYLTLSTIAIRAVLMRPLENGDK